MRLCWWVLFSASGVLLAYLAFLYGFNQSFSTGAIIDLQPQFLPHPSYPFLVTRVAEWGVKKESEKVANRAAYEGQPVKWKGSIIEDWPALQKWKDPSYVKVMLPILPKVGHLRGRSEFLYFHDRPLANLSGITELRRTAPEQIQDMPTSDFFDKVFSPASKKAEQRDYYYYADNIFALNPRLVEDITPFQQLLVKETTNPKPYKPLKMLAWMGSANATTHLHYDWSHNFHAVLRGKKHFMLFPPSDWENLYLYPSLHPYGTKSQVDMTDPLEVTNFPRLNQAHGYEVEVSAGEALYIPPLWFHQVKALESSISVSIWSESIETVMFDQAVALGVPFDKEWTKKQMVLAAILFTEKLFTANEEYNDQAAAAPTKPEEDGMALHPAGILERVSQLFSSAVSSLSTVIANGQNIDEATEEESEKPSPSERGRNLIRRIILSRYQHVREKVVKEGERAASVWPLCPSAAEATNSDARTLLVSFSDSVDSLMELLGVIEAGRREIWLGDYLEIMANLVASPKEIIPYMGCLRGLLKPAA